METPIVVVITSHAVHKNEEILFTKNKEDEVEITGNILSVTVRSFGTIITGDETLNIKKKIQEDTSSKSTSRQEKTSSGKSTSRQQSVQGEMHVGFGQVGVMNLAPGAIPYQYIGKGQIGMDYSKKS